MTSNYPDSLDSFVNPTGTSKLNNPDHAAQHANANDSILAIETELGTNPRGSDASVTARLDRMDDDIADAGSQIFINIMDSGAVANGIYNCTSIIQAAIDAANTAGGGTIYFPKGNYLFTTLTMKSNVKLFGDGPGATKLTSSLALGVAIDCKGTYSGSASTTHCKSAAISDMKVMSSVGGSNATVGINLEHASSVIISNVEVEDFLVLIRGYGAWNSAIHNFRGIKGGSRDGSSEVHAIQMLSDGNGGGVGQSVDTYNIIFSGYFELYDCYDGDINISGTNNAKPKNIVFPKGGIIMTSKIQGASARVLVSAAESIDLDSMSFTWRNFNSGFDTVNGISFLNSIDCSVSNSTFSNSGTNTLDSYVIVSGTRSCKITDNKWSTDADPDTAHINISGTNNSLTIRDNGFSRDGLGTYLFVVLGTATSSTTSSGGDLSGEVTDATVVGIQGTTVSNTAPSTGEALVFDGSDYVPTDVMTNTEGLGFLKRDGSNVMTGDLVLAGDPSLDLHAATKQYVDNSAAGIQRKQEVVGATADGENVNLAVTLDGVVIDGSVSLEASNRVLLRNQSDASENGIYVVAASPGLATRASDMNTGSEALNAAVLSVNGDTNFNTSWACSNTTTPTLDTDDLTFVRISSNGVSSTTNRAITAAYTTAQVAAARVAEVEYNIDNIETISKVRNTFEIGEDRWGFDLTGVKASDAAWDAMYANVKSGDRIIFPANSIIRFDLPKVIGDDGRYAIDMIGEGTQRETASIPTCTIKAGAAMSYMFKIIATGVTDNKSSATISGISFDGQANVTNELILINSKSVKIRYCGLLGFKQGVAAAGSTSFETMFAGVRVGGSSSSGESSSLAQDIDIFSCFAKGEYKISSIAVHINRAADCKITWNRFAHTDYAIACNSPSNFITDNHVFGGGGTRDGSGNTTTGRAGIYIMQSFNNVSSNYIDNYPIGASIVIDSNINGAAIDSTSIVNNLFLNNDNGSWSKHPGIRLLTLSAANGIRGLIVSQNTFRGIFSTYAFKHVVESNNWSHIKGFNFSYNQVRGLVDTDGALLRPRPFYDTTATTSTPVPHVITGNMYQVTSGDDWLYDEQEMPVSGLVNNTTVQSHRLWKKPDYYYIQEANTQAVTAGRAYLSSSDSTQFIISAANSPSGANYFVRLKVGRGDPSGRSASFT